MSVCILLFCPAADAYTTEHHLVNMSRDLANVVAAPVKAVFINGPRAIKKMYRYEVHGQEKPENRQLLHHRIYSMVSSPAVESKALIDGVVSSVTFAGKFFKELLSIPFSD
jgi:phosphoribosylformylglycinamidine (FGAM) synthase-like enzyme